MAEQLNIRVPASLREEAKRAAEADGVSLNQFCALAVARAVGEWQARRFFTERARGLEPEEARQRLRELLARVGE